MAGGTNFKIERKLWSFGEHFDIYDAGKKKIMTCRTLMIKSDLYFYGEQPTAPPVMVVKQKMLKRGLFAWSNMYTIYSQNVSPLFFIKCDSKINGISFFLGSRCDEPYIRTYKLLDQYKKIIGTIAPNNLQNIDYFKFCVSDAPFAKFYRIAG